MQFNIVLSLLLLALTSLVIGSPVVPPPTSTLSSPLRWWEQGPGPVGLPHEAPDRHSPVPSTLRPSLSSSASLSSSVPIPRVSFASVLPTANATTTTTTTIVVKRAAADGLNLDAVLPIANEMMSPTSTSTSDDKHGKDDKPKDGFVQHFKDKAAEVHAAVELADEVEKIKKVGDEAADFDVSGAATAAQAVHWKADPTRLPALAEMADKADQGW